MPLFFANIIRVHPRYSRFVFGMLNTAVFSLRLSRKNNKAGNTVMDAVDENNIVNAMSQPKRANGGMEANTSTRKPNPTAAAL